MADLQTLIDAGLSPQDAASLLASLQGGGLLAPASVNAGVAATPTSASVPDLQAITAPLSNKGNPTSILDKGANAFTIAAATPIRLVDNSTNQVIYEGVGYDAAQEATRIAQDLSNTYGKKASWEIQSSAPDSSTWTTLAQENKNKSPLGVIADIALPIAASFIPGVGPVLGAAIGSGASSVAQGRSLTDTLLRAGLAAGGSALGGSLFGKAIPPGATSTMTGINADLIPNALADLSFGSIASTSIPAGVGGGVGAAAGSAVDDIIVTALKQATPNLFSSSLAPSIMSTAPSLLDAIARQYPSYTAPNQQPMTSKPAPDETIVNAQVPPTVPIPTPVPSITGSLLANAAQTALPETGPIDTVKKPSLLDKALGSMSIADYLTLGGIAASGVGSLMGGGGGGAAVQTPYTSPFGAIGGFGAGRDMRANPNIADYERYGFGPEATFFQPQYNQLVSSTFQPAPQAYKPLING